MVELQTSVAFISELLERESPAGLDMSYIEGLIARHSPHVKKANIDIMKGIANIKEFPKKHIIHKCEYWEARIRKHSEPTLLVSEEVAKKLADAEELNIPFKWFIWVEQYFTKPETVFVPSQQKKYIVTEHTYYYKVPTIQIRRDPALIGLIPCGKDLGIPYLFGSWTHE